MSGRESQSFIKGAAILGVAAILVKILGAVFRIPLANLIGPEGMSYYQSAYPIYIYLLVVSTAGFPAAVAKTISEKTSIGDYDGADHVLRVAFGLMFSVGLASTLIMFLGADFIAESIKNPMAYYSIMALAPALVFSSIMSVFRGYFQGIQHMQPYAVSQFVEQFFRVVFGLGLVFLFIDKGTEYAAASATFGATAGGIAGFVIIFWMYVKYRKTHPVEMTGVFEQESKGKIVKHLLMIAIPITLGATIMPIMQLVDLAIVMPRLNSIGIVEQANDLYGLLTGYAQTLINLPQTITAAVQISLVPAVASFAIKKDFGGLKKTVQNGLRIGLMIGLPCSVGLVVLAEPIMQLLYPMQLETVEMTGHILSILGWGVVFLSTFQISTGILQGLGKQVLPARNLAIGATVKAVLTYVLVGIPSLNIMGAAIATVTSYMISSVLNYFSLIKYSEAKIDVKDVFIKPMVSVAVMGVIAKLSYWVLSVVVSGNLATVGAICIAGLAYGMMLLVTKSFSEADFELLPKGQRIKNTLLKYNLLKL
ncbi:MAG: polysaccharide biosynthesis protein [Clostridia bacterium]|nr:polysaccharide biosynthesis protein [Clostridia bacterium]